MISALRMEKAALQQQLREAKNEATSDSEATISTGELRESTMLPTGPVEGAQQGFALTNLLAENALLRQKLEELERASAQQESNRHQTPSIEAAKVSSQTTSSVPSIDANERPWTEEQLEAYRCANQVNQINIAATLWAEAHGGFGPTHFAELHEYLAPMMLVCPSRKPKSIAHSWKNFDVSTISYRMQEPGAKWTGGRVIFMCPHHEIASMNSPGAYLIPSKYKPKF